MSNLVCILQSMHQSTRNHGCVGAAGPQQATSSLFQEPTWQDPPLTALLASARMAHRPLQPSATATAVGTSLAPSSWHANQLPQNGSTSGNAFSSGGANSINRSSANSTPSIITPDMPDHFQVLQSDAAVSRPSAILQPPKLAPPPAGKAAPLHLGASRIQTGSNGNFSLSGHQQKLKQDSLI